MISKEKMAELLSASIENEGFELIEIKLSRYKRSSRLQVFIDSDRGVEIDDCAHLSKVIGSIIDARNIFDYGYVIEVSSPGLDRPLHTARDFRRRIGEEIRIFFNDNEMPPLQGELVGTNERYIELQTRNGKNKYDLVNVRMGKIIF